MGLKEMQDIIDRRERLGRLVRKIWIEWAMEQEQPKQSWLVPWDDLSEPEREVDRRIGAAVWAHAVDEFAEDIANGLVMRLRSKA